MGRADLQFCLGRKCFLVSGESCGSGLGDWAKGEVDSMILFLFFGRERKHPPTLQVFRIFCCA